MCLVRGGHEIILSAFDNFKTVKNTQNTLNNYIHTTIDQLTDSLIGLLQVCSETMRFEKLMEHFKNEDDNIDFLVTWS